MAAGSINKVIKRFQAKWQTVFINLFIKLKELIVSSVTAMQLPVITGILNEQQNNEGRVCYSKDNSFFTSTLMLFVFLYFWSLFTIISLPAINNSRVFLLWPLSHQESYQWFVRYFVSETDTDTHAHLYCHLLWRWTIIKDEKYASTGINNLGHFIHTEKGIEKRYIIQKRFLWTFSSVLNTIIVPVV